MSKCIIFISNFQKRPSTGGSSSPAPLNFDVGDQKLHDLAKLLFFKLIMTNSNLKVSVMILFQ